MQVPEPRKPQANKYGIGSEPARMRTEVSAGSVVMSQGRPGTVSCADAMLKIKIAIRNGMKDTAGNLMEKKP
jgi:hypothetical protein